MKEEVVKKKRVGPRTKFQKGDVGNPKGRPKGCLNHRTLIINALKGGEQDLVNKAAEMALAGNESMLKLFLERVLPPKIKEMPLPDCEFKGSLADNGKQVLELLASGKVTPNEAGNIMNCLEQQFKLMHGVELEKRIEELEGMLNKHSEPKSQHIEGKEPEADSF